MEVWAHEICYCRFKTGFKVDSLHSTEELAIEKMNSRKEECEKYYDGSRVMKWEVNTTTAKGE